LNWNLVAGCNAFFINGSDNYTEIFVGLENILKVFRVDFVSSFNEGKASTTGVRIGTGGLIGSSIKKTSITGGTGNANAMSF
jgi:hypothetical protein